MKKDSNFRTGYAQVSVTASQKNSIDYDDVHSSLDDSQIASKKRPLIEVSDSPINGKMQAKRGSLPELARMTDFAPTNMSTRRSSNIIGGNDKIG